MSGTILENLSGKKLTILVSFLMLCQLVCFLIGGFVGEWKISFSLFVFYVYKTLSSFPSVYSHLAPVPSSHQTVLATICRDKVGSHNDTSMWIYSRGPKPCEVLDHTEILTDSYRMANQLVFVFQMPLPRDGRNLDYSRWQQNLIGILQTDIAFDSKTYTEPVSEITLDMRLAYRNKEDPEDEWKYYANSLEKRDLSCQADNKTDKYLLQCDTIPVFEMGSLHHDFYLLNVRIPVDTNLKMNENIGYIMDLHLTVIYQNGGFTKVWVSLKTIFFPFIVAIMAWFWNRVHLLQRKPVLLEYMLIYLGAALTFLNCKFHLFNLLLKLINLCHKCHWSTLRCLSK